MKNEGGLGYHFVELLTINKINSRGAEKAMISHVIHIPAEIIVG